MVKSNKSTKSLHPSIYFHLIVTSKICEKPSKFSKSDHKVLFVSVKSLTIPTLCPIVIDYTDTMSSVHYADIVSE